MGIAHAHLFLSIHKYLNQNQSDLITYFLWSNAHSLFLNASTSLLLISLPQEFDHEGQMMQASVNSWYLDVCIAVMWASVWGAILPYWFLDFTLLIKLSSPSFVTVFWSWSDKSHFHQNLWLVLDCTQGNSELLKFYTLTENVLIDVVSASHYMDDCKSQRVVCFTLTLLMSQTH